MPSLVHTPSRSDVSGKQRSASARPDVTSNQAAAGQQSGQPGTQSLMKSGQAGRDGEDVDIMGTEDFAFNTRLGDSWQRPGAFMDLQLSLPLVIDMGMPRARRWTGGRSKIIKSTTKLQTERTPSGPGRHTERKQTHKKLTPGLVGGRGLRKP